MSEYNSFYQDEMIVLPNCSILSFIWGNYLTPTVIEIPMEYNVVKL